jgi:hypothetical protein
MSKVIGFSVYSKSDTVVIVDGHCTLSTRPLYLPKHSVKVGEDERKETNDGELLKYLPGLRPLTSSHENKISMVRPTATAGAFGKRGFRYEGIVCKAMADRGSRSLVAWQPTRLFTSCIVCLVSTPLADGLQ